MQPPRIAFFPDSFLELNGFAGTSRALDATVRRRGLPFLTVHAGPELCEAHDAEGGRLQLPRSPVSLPLDDDLEYDVLFWRHASRIRRALQRFQPDVVHITGPNDVSQLGAWTAWRLGVPTVASWHTNVHEFAARRAARWLRALPADVNASLLQQIERRVLDLTVRLYRTARAVLAPNAELVQMLGRRTGRPARLMGRGVDPERFSPARRTVRDGIFRLGFVGRLNPEKNVRLLAEIERALLSRGVRPFRFVVVGRGSEQAWLARTMRFADLPGALTGDALARAYADMDVFLFPSTADAFGNVVLEALASGTPAIVTSAGGPRTIIEDGVSGFVADSADAFAEYVAALMASPPRLERMRRAARARAQHFSWDRIVEQVYDTYAEALRPHVMPVAPEVATR